MVPLKVVDGFPRRVSEEWLREYLPKFMALAVSLSDLLAVPMSGEDFVNSLYELLLEMDVWFSTGSAARVLAGRTLKNHRWARSQSTGRSGASETATAATGDRPGGTEVTSSGSSLVSAKPHFLNEYVLSQTIRVPSYDLVVPSLCTTVIFAYRRMCDFDSTEQTENVRLILQTDRRLKKLFFGNLSKEISVLARMRTVQQAYVITDHLFGAFSHADDHLVEELLKARPLVASDGVEKDEEDASSTAFSVAHSVSSRHNADPTAGVPEFCTDDEDDY
jgi:hypothetical protein